MIALLEKWTRRCSGNAASGRETAEQDAYAYGAQLLSETREELYKADSKAQVLLGTIGVGLGAITGGLLAGSWSPFALANVVEWLWWAGSGAALASVVVLAGAVYPRLDRKDRSPTSGVTYFAHIPRYASAEAVSDALIRSSAFDLQRVAHQLHQVSVIAVRKYQLIRCGFWLALSAILATLSAILVNLVV